VDRDRWRLAIPERADLARRHARKATCRQEHHGERDSDHPS
jgi:hypothetical protein